MNYYQILKINQNASLDEINQSFRNLAKKYHPDYNSEYDAKEKFMNIYLAYSVLKDPKTKKEYDKTIKNSEHKTEIKTQKQSPQRNAKKQTPQKTEADLSSEKTSVDSVKSGIAVLTGEWVYYINQEEQNKLYRIRTDGTDRQIICEGSVASAVQPDYNDFSAYDGRHL